jgi:hypothetical protein
LRATEAAVRMSDRDQSNVLHRNTWSLYQHRPYRATEVEHPLQR